MMDLRVGTSGFSYAPWKGSFYPEKIKAAEMLRFYATRFATVEINATFYRMPSETMLAGWAQQVGEAFTFGLKAPQRITHFQRLVEAGDTARRFVDLARTLGSRLGPLLFQLPPNFKKDIPRLTDFLAQLPPDLDRVFEFRHPSWFDEEVQTVLRERGICLCWEESEELASPFVATASVGYLRLRRLDYPDSELQIWVDRLRAQPWKRAYVYFKHEDSGSGPRFAARFRELWTAAG
jgi:uncharacterized protein YecE (DUF72 family)